MDLWQNLKSPIQEEAERQYELIRPSISWFSCHDICQTCGRKENVGIYECMTGRFKCLDCIKRQIVSNLEQDVDWQKRERVFNLRRARLTREIVIDPRKRDDEYIQYRMRGGRHEEVPDWTSPTDPFMVEGIQRLGSK